MPRKVIGYARVNARDELSLDCQVAQLQAAGAVEVLIDVQSRMTKERVGFNRLITMIQADQVEAVVVTRIDRMTRPGHSFGSFWMFAKVRIWS